MAILFVFTFLFFSSSILSFFTDNNEILINAEKYIKIVIFTAPFLMIMSAFTGAFQANGNTKTPMFIAIIVNIINIVIGYLLIYGKFGFPKLA
ncbi:MAG: MATE family efflux transporter, partial [Tissierellia bacterium]|nr:MATE family efflux transporter [Tissierellia bacterium]